MVANEALLHNWFYGNMYVRELAAVVFAVLMGSVPVTPIMHWLFGDLDVRIARTAAALAPVVNTCKALIPVAIATHGGGTGVGLAAAVAVVAGHCYCPWRRFQGGTGVAVLFGALLGVCWPAALIFFTAWFVVAVGSNYAAVGSLLSAALSIVSLWYFLGAPGAFAGVAMLLLVAGRFGNSFAGLSEGTEPTLRAQPVPARANWSAPVTRRASVVVDGQTVQRV
jgi:glycerol-3-phosphate acyltransferase PlsY